MEGQSTAYAPSKAVVHPDDAPWTPAERAAARGRARYLHAEHDPPADRRRLLDWIVADDLNAIRLRR